MSHFAVFVISPQALNDEEISDIMAPWDENEHGHEQGKWDWFTVGGRWTGMLDPSYDLEKDPNNFEECWLCHGSGDRDGTPGCNGCEGTGRNLKFPTEFADIGNRLTISEHRNIRAEHDIYPFAIIVNGEWKERGQMIMFGIADNEKERDVWTAECDTILDLCADTDVITVVDCHV